MLARAFSSIGDHSRGLALAQGARQLSPLQADMAAQAFATAAEAFCHAKLGNFLNAKILYGEASELSKLNLTLKVALDEQLVDIHAIKTEYSEARALAFTVLDYRSSRQPPIRDTVTIHLNLAIIGIATGYEAEKIKHYLDTVYLQCTTFVVYPSALTYYEAATAQLHLREGNVSLAREKFEECFVTFQKSRDEQGLQMCLEMLGDTTHSMYQAGRRFSWAVLSLAFGMSFKSMLVTVSALSLIGDIFAAETDDETTLNILSTSLHGFTLMDIHRDRARCMVSMGRIYERSGNLEEAVELWEQARPLFKRASQAMDVAKVDLMVQSAKIKMAASKNLGVISIQPAPKM
jgi:tetratricopeptide (TPR) repeat protein